MVAAGATRALPWGRRVSRAAGSYVLLLPAAIALALVSLYPLVYGIIASLRRYLYGVDHGSAGIGNYQYVLQDQTFITALGTTARYVVLCVVIETVLGLGLALLVNRQLAGASLWRIGIILPMTVAPVVVGVMWRLIYASDIGIADPLLGLLGVHGVHVLGGEASAFLGVVLLDVWEWTPLMFLILLAGLQGIPQEPLEAALMDGASGMRIFFDHVLPMLRPVLFVAVVLRTIDAIGTFDQVYVLTRGGPGVSTQLFSIYAYNSAFLFSQFGRTMAMVVLLLAAVLVLAAIAIRLVRSGPGTR
ncbi:MAG: sugar ABC transporter permease [Candidatus Dormibacteraeota bacterium]|nr:sugar ABC transporter permease [Candidatus Dormibacteraeota bacterium]